MAKLKVALKDATLKMLQAQEAQTQLEDALLANHEIRLSLQKETEEIINQLHDEVEYFKSELEDERLAKEAFFRDSTIDFDNPENN